MTIKSLTITEDAYNTLKRLKHADESFSEVILRVGKEKTGAAAKFFGILKMSEAEAEAWKKRVRENRNEFDRDFSERQKKFRAALNRSGHQVD